MFLPPRADRSFYRTIVPTRAVGKHSVQADQWNMGLNMSVRVKQAFSQPGGIYTISRLLLVLIAKVVYFQARQARVDQQECRDLQIPPDHRGVQSRPATENKSKECSRVLWRYCNESAPYGSRRRAYGRPAAT